MKPCFQPGAVVLFQGDSVTDCDRDRSDAAHLGQGYAGRVATIYQALFPADEVRFYNRGVSGNRTGDLLDRYEADFLAPQPDFISILIGINDVWRRYDQGDPTSPERFHANYRELLTRLRRDLPDAQLLLIEPFLLPSTPDKAGWQEDLGPKLQLVRSLAGEFADYFLPLDGIINACACTGTAPQALSLDGVHPTPQGHGLIAYHYLRTLGVL